MITWFTATTKKIVSNSFRFLWDQTERNFWYFQISCMYINWNFKKAAHKYKIFCSKPIRKEFYGKALIFLKSSQVFNFDMQAWVEWMGNEGVPCYETLSNHNNLFSNLKITESLICFWIDEIHVDTQRRVETFFCWFIKVLFPPLFLKLKSFKKTHSNPPFHIIKPEIIS